MAKQSKGVSGVLAFNSQRRSKIRGRLTKKGLRIPQSAGYTCGVSVMSMIESLRKILGDDFTAQFSGGDYDIEEKDRAILHFIQKNHGFAGTAEIAEEINLTVQGAEYRLANLEEVGVVSSRVVSRDKVWYLTDFENNE
ncbi:MAG: winged helix-turn-helix transcriptional regulator [Halobacteriaceae archaeon]